MHHRLDLAWTMYEQKAEEVKAKQRKIESQQAIITTLYSFQTIYLTLKLLVRLPDQNDTPKETLAKAEVLIAEFEKKVGKNRV
jgi:hypothetical protein